MEAASLLIPFEKPLLDMCLAAFGGFGAGCLLNIERLNPLCLVRGCDHSAATQPTKAAAKMEAKKPPPYPPEDLLL